MTDSNEQADIDFVATLLRRHADLLGRFRVMPQDPEACGDIRHSISHYSSVDDPSGNIIQSARTWFERCMAKPHPPAEQRFFEVHELLSVLNDHFSGLTPRAIPVSGTEMLFLGRSWWDSYLKNRGIHFPNFSSQMHFPCIRLVSLQSEEFVNHPEQRKMFREVIVDQALRIALCSLSGKARTHFVPTELVTGGFGFRAQSIGIGDDENSKKEYVDELLETFRQARDAGAHIVLYPELSVCPSGQAALKKELATQPGKICMVVGGSFHTTRDDACLNASPIWLTHRLNEPVTTHEHWYAKTERVSFGTEQLRSMRAMHEVVEAADSATCDQVIEDIQVGLQLRVFKTPVGRFGVAICKDLLVDGKIVRRYVSVVDHLLVISMQASPFAWFDALSEPSVRRGVATIYVNATQVIAEDEPETQAAFWRLPMPGTSEWISRSAAATPLNGRWGQPSVLDEAGLSVLKIPVLPMEVAL